jgi:hypothetical protein
MPSFKLPKLASLLASLLISFTAHAGVDVVGPVTRVHLAPDGTLWFLLAAAPASTHCKGGWAELNMFVPKDHPSFAYYFAMITAANLKSKNLYVANIDMFGGTRPCDVTASGYGVMLMQ